MRIAFLDTSTLDCGSFDLSPLKELGSVELHATTSPDEVIPRCQAVEIVITNKVVLDREVLMACPNLRYVVVAATGTNNVDLEVAAEQGLPVSNVSGYSTPGVVQHVWALVLALATSVHRFAGAGEPSRWAESPIFTRLEFPIGEIAGRRLGIAGLGDIGSGVAKVGEAFGMEVVGLSRVGAGASGQARLERQEFFDTCDVISLHCPLVPETEGMINQETLGWMKPSSFLINTGRGPLVIEQDLISALETGSIAGAGLDVLSVEPPSSDNPLLDAAERLPNLVVTPHTAWASLESRGRLLETVIGHVRTFVSNGEVRERVGPST